MYFKKGLQSKILGGTQSVAIFHQQYDINLKRPDE